MGNGKTQGIPDLNEFGFQLGKPGTFIPNKDIALLHEHT